MGADPWILFFYNDFFGKNDGAIIWDFDGEMRQVTGIGGAARSNPGNTSTILGKISPGRPTLTKGGQDATLRRL